MGFLLFKIFAFLNLTLVVVASHATTSLPPQLYYWNSIFPDTPMPKALSQLVQPNFTSVGNGDLSFLSQDAAQNDPPFRIYQRDVDFLSQDVAQNDPPFRHYPKFGVLNRVIFFVEKDMHPGKTMKYRLATNSTRATFLSCKTAESIPFSSRELPEILNQYLVKPGSVEEVIIKETVQECETQGFKGEEKQCTTSLESMIEYATSKLGRNIQAISTEVEKRAATVQNYTISPGMKNLSVADKKRIIVCHKMSYLYAIHYCHTFGRTRAYMVPLQGSDGTIAKTVAICHPDTSGWNPNSYALQEVKVKPGTVTVCHFLPESEIA